jgi:integrase
MSIRKRTWTTRKGVTKEAWICDYVDQTGERHIKTFDRKKDAEQWATQARHEISQGTHTPASTSLTVTEAWRAWIDHCDAEGLEKSTIRQRQQHLALHVTPFIGREKLSGLTMPGIHRFDDQLRAAGRSPAMRRKVLVNVKTMLSFAQGRGYVAQNVARGVRLKNDDRAAAGPLREGKDFPSRSELKMLIDAASGRWRPLLITAIFTGLRASELRGLRWSDVDLEAGLIHVRQRADAWGTIGPPKSKAGKRDVPLAPIVVNALRQWQQECPRSDTGLVFPNGKGNVESFQNIWHRFWIPLQISCGITTPAGKARYGWHMLRHAAASLFIAHLNWTPKRLQAVMGHSTIAVTYDTYGHLLEDRDGDRDSMQKIEAAVGAA